MGKNEYYILNVLRGLSALFVIFYHFFIFFFAHQEFSANLFLVEPVYLPDPFYLQFLQDLPFDVGHLAVAFFFLISGFLILPSLERYSSLKTFLVHKVFRLWPTYIICFSIGLLFVAGFYAIGNTPFPYDLGHVLSCFFWVRDIFHYPYIDGSVWTLEVQIKFYIFMGLVWSLGNKKFLERICILTMVLSILVFGLYSFMEDGESSWFYLVILARKNLKYFLLILLGTCLYAFYKKQISWQKGLILGGGMLAFFLSPLFHSPDPTKTTSYTLGLILFSYFILVHGKSVFSKGLSSRVITWVSEISYPLYVGHVVPGYIIMYFIIECGLSVYLGIGIALVYAFVMAEIVHKKIEAAFLKMGNKVLLYFKKNQFPSP